MIKRFHNRLPEYRDKIGVIGGGEYYPNFLTFGTVQTLHNSLKKGDEEIKAILDKFEVVIVDEAHRMKASQFYEVVSACNNATFRIALTATPFMRDDHEENQQLRGGIGDVISKTTNKDLVDAGILAKPYVKFVKVEQPDNIRHLSNYREVYEKGISQNQHRNKIVVNQTKSLLKMRDKVLVIVTEIKHGEALKELFQKNDINTEFCSGSMSVSDRTKLLKKLETGKLNVLIASTIFDEGIDIKAIGGVVLAGGGKSVPALYQRIGRSMRKKKQDNYCVVIDFWDMTHRILNNHSKQRYKVVKEDEAFTILGG
jgi:superfamily II DNA or RNA helicase